MSYFFWLGRDAGAEHAATAYAMMKDTRRRMRAAGMEPRGVELGFVGAPLCDGDFTEEETVESDGFITCYFSGPIRPIQS